jgi:hypothetical protein
LEIIEELTREKVREGREKETNGERKAKKIKRESKEQRERKKGGSIQGKECRIRRNI